MTGAHAVYDADWARRYLAGASTSQFGNETAQPLRASIIPSTINRERTERTQNERNAR